jgi:hypothetical protein
MLERLGSNDAYANFRIADAADGIADTSQNGTSWDYDKQISSRLNG